MVDDDTTFLSPDDFHRAQNITAITASETQSMPVLAPLNDPEMHYTYYEGDMMIQESDENKVKQIFSFSSFERIIFH